MKLYLQDGTVIEGENFGASIPAGKQVHGEVVFNTGMVGYPEGLTDPSYAGQIVVLTYPLIGNYGVPDPKTLESEKIQIAGLVVSEYCEQYSHAGAKMSLAKWLKDSGVPAISGVDTRALTKKLREHGVMLGALGAEKQKKFFDPNEENLVAAVSPKKKKMYGPTSLKLRRASNGPIKIVAIDCGMKENIVRSLARKETTVIRVPWDYDFTRDDYDALFISNGPGDPTQCVKTIEHIRDAMKKNKPILGICLGNQLLALAAGAKTYKLPYGHRSQNQPCVEEKTKRCYITSQNHGYAVDEKTLPAGWEEWFTNANDGSNEGIRHKNKPWRSVQFHPEATPGPTDTAWIFDDFLKTLKAV
ncbi:carbamoyl phosphate synthase small subunit [Candidatus Kaiserbacteria bacterium RIFCSPHIGHO2_02_FULL_54_11b]|uniref:Carbamoyl phosphate synthase small chain n=2 Tax=Candidatus Kaiseribacteriota TaxID=1752734 RepID=A0A1F6CLE9_9BACT|nr:MAG: carbamoyl phosphate synthase small subunit [Candidatus Kaiserbacteria bacterium RIFCSPHIGHO2_01_FULL_54_36b]OGG64319.1 MAG: carbamoyl phosphate synthase small subunit [Candidatus Kaiserbacteria bacterium RIFCSPHIGHO2_02_FULL_54_11b]